LNARLAGITRYSAKGSPGEKLIEAELIAGLGLAGDYHQGGERQLSLLSAETRAWLDRQNGQGLCFARFKENLLLEGFASEYLADGSSVQVGDAVLRIHAEKKYCHTECPLFSGGETCKLPESVLFAEVERGGTIKTGDSIDRKV
jgi:MOSC domain-containing protein YiiM